MNAVIDYLGVRTSGFILLGIALGLLTIGTVIGIRSVTRWLTIDDIETSRLDLLDNDLNAARQDAREAAVRMSRDATAVMPTIDLTSDEGAKTLENLATRVPPKQRDLVQAVTALSQALRGQPPLSVSGSDGVLIKYIADLAKGSAQPPKLERDSPPHATTLDIALHQQFRAAWAAGDAAAIRRAGGMMLLFAPTLKGMDRVKALLASLDAGSTDAQISALMSNVGDVGERVTLIRQISRLAPARMNSLLILIPDDRKTPEERMQAQLGGDEKLDVLVKRALDTPNETVVERLLPRCFKEGRADLAKPLIALLRAERQPQYQLALATSEGDLLAVAQLSGDKPELVPRVSTPIALPGRIIFHLSNTAGFIARSPIEIRVAGVPLAPAKIQRFACLVSAEVGTAAAPYEVRMGGRVVFSGQVSP